MASVGKTPCINIHRHRDLNHKALSKFRSGASIHSHTHFSKENLGFIPFYASRIPWLAGQVKRSCERYRSLNGTDLDFARAYWTPPLSPEEVWSSEVKQIEEDLGMAALVSITDHDDIDAPKSLEHRVPISMEWTIPFGDFYFHLGVHNMEAGLEEETARELQRFTFRCSDYSASDLLSMLHHSPRTLVVLNHPLWDVERAGKEAHRAALRAFLTEHHDFIHAVEINGFRPWAENLDIFGLGEAWAMPVVAGGDRHGTAPNTVLNVTAASTMEEFAMEVREDRISDVVLMPGYGRSQLTQQLRIAGDAVQFYPEHPSHRRQWVDRVFFEKEDGNAQPLSTFLPEGTPPTWLEVVVTIMQGLGHSSLHRLINGVLPTTSIVLPTCISHRTSFISTHGPVSIVSCPTLTQKSER